MHERKSHQPTSEVDPTVKPENPEKDKPKHNPVPSPNVVPDGPAPPFPPNA